MKLKEYREELKYKMRKTPKLISEFEKLVGLYIGNNKNINEIKDKEISNIKIEYMNGVLDKFYTNRNLFKNINLEIKGRKLNYSYMKGVYIVWKSMEDFDDNMSHEIYKSKVLKYQNSILRENIELANNETFEKFATLFDLNISKEKVSKELKKIKAFYMSEQLNNSLDKILEIFNLKTIDYYIEESIKTDGCEIVSKNNNILILDIKDYEASKKFGSSQWCISYDKNNWEDYLYSTGEITKVHKENLELEEYITENYISAMFSLEKGYIRKDLFNIMLCKNWEKESFLKDTINKEYNKLDKEDKIELFKNIRNMPPKNVYCLLDRINKDKEFKLVSGDLYYQDIFEMASTEVFYTGDIKNYRNLIKEIKRTIKDRTDSFTGNGLFFHNDKVIGIYEKSTSSFSKIENIIKNDIINKNDLFEFIKKMEEKSLSSSFTGIDRILLKKHGYDNFINYFKDKYYKEKKVIKP